MLFFLPYAPHSLIDTGGYFWWNTSASQAASLPEQPPQAPAASPPAAGLSGPGSAGRRLPAAGRACGVGAGTRQGGRGDGGGGKGRLFFLYPHRQAAAPPARGRPPSGAGDGDKRGGRRRRDLLRGCGRVGLLRYVTRGALVADIAAHF